MSKYVCVCAPHMCARVCACVCMCVCVCVCPRAVAFSRSRCHARARSLSLCFLECTRRTSSRRTLVISLARFKISHTHSRSFSCAHIIHLVLGACALCLSHTLVVSHPLILCVRALSLDLSLHVRALSHCRSAPPQTIPFFSHTHTQHSYRDHPSPGIVCLFVG